MILSFLVGREQSQAWGLFAQMGFRWSKGSVQSILSPQAARWNRALAGREGVKLDSLRAGQDDTYAVQDRW